MTDGMTDRGTNTLASRGLEEPPRLRVGWRNRKKKVLVVCLAGARSILQPEKKRDRYYNQKKKVLVVCLAGARSLLRPERKSSSPVSGGCAIVITTGKKKVLTGKKNSSCLSGGCAIVITTGKKVLV